MQRSMVSAIFPGHPVPGSKQSRAWQMGSTSRALSKWLNKSISRCWAIGPFYLILTHLRKVKEQQQFGDCGSQTLDHRNPKDVDPPSYASVRFHLRSSGSLYGYFHLGFPERKARK